MESLGYVLMYFNRGSLPWQGLRAATKKQKYDKIRERKLATPIETLCKGFPGEFASYFNHTRSLQFEDKPDYHFLRQLFRSVFHRENFSYDYIFDWTVLKFQQQQAQNSQRMQEIADGGNEPKGDSGRSRERDKDSKEKTVSASARNTTSQSRRR